MKGAAGKRVFWSLFLEYMDLLMSRYKSCWQWAVVSHADNASNNDFTGTFFRLCSLSFSTQGQQTCNLALPCIWPTTRIVFTDDPFCDSDIGMRVKIRCVDNLGASFYTSITEIAWNVPVAYLAPARYALLDKKKKKKPCENIFSLPLFLTFIFLNIFCYFVTPEGIVCIITLGYWSGLDPGLVK